MRKFGLAACVFGFLFGAGSVFSDQTVNVHIPSGGAQDLLNMTSIPPEISDSNSDEALQRACTNPSGRIVRQNDPGYSDCLALARGKKTKTRIQTNSDPGIFVHP